MPQIYEWLSGALLRGHELAEARDDSRRSGDKWPTDGRFTKPLAMVYGTFGRGREAVRTLERYLAAHADDRDAHTSACSGCTRCILPARWCTRPPKT